MLIKKERSLLYVIEAETFVSKTLRPFVSNVEEHWQYDSMAPTHFLGELTKTPEGCAYLKEKGLVTEYCEFVRVHGMEAVEDVILMNIKTALWALVSLPSDLADSQGNIGSTEGGLLFLEDEEIVEVIVEIAEQSPVLTIRGCVLWSKERAVLNRAEHAFSSLDSYRQVVKGPNSSKNSVGSLRELRWVAIRGYACPMISVASSM